MSRPVFQRAACAAALLFCAAARADDGTPPRQLGLSEALALALPQAPRITQAEVEGERARLRVLRAQLDRVRASVDVGVTELYNRRNIGGATPPGPVDVVLGLTNLQASVSAPLFSGFRVTANVDAAEQGEKAAALEVEAARQEALLAVARVYWSARRTQMSLGAVAQSATRLQESLRLVKARVAAGLAAPLDDNRAQARVADLAVEEAQLRATAQEQLAELATLVGLVDDSGQPVPLALTEEATAGAAPGDVGALLHDALAQRSDVRSMDAQRRVLDAQLRAAWSAYYPQLSVQALAEYGNNPSVAGAGNRTVLSTANPFAGLVGNVQVGAALGINLFDTLVTTHQVRDVELRIKRQEAERAQLVQSVSGGVRQAHARVVGLAQTRTALVQARALADDNATILERAYARGEVPLVEALDAQLQALSATRQIIDLDARLSLAHLELTAAAGAPLLPTGASSAPAASPASPASPEGAP